MNLALEDSKASGGSGGGRTEAMPSQSRAGMNLFKQSGADQPAASPESQFDMVERLKNDNRSEIERRIEDIDPGYTRVLGGMEHRVPTTSFEDDYIREKKASDPALSGNEGKVAAKGDALLNEGREAYAKGEYQQAVEKYRYALEHDPDEDHRKNYTAHLGDASVALSMQHRKVGKYTEARELLDGVLAKDPSNEEAKRELGYLDDPIRSNPALNYQHGELTDEVRHSLYTAEGNFNLGKYDEAKREFETALRVDPYNAAARRGLERVDTAKTDYYRAAYDHTRAELLGTVDKSWELTLPAEKDADPADQDFDLKKRLEGEVAQQAERVATYTGMRITPPARDLGDDAVKEAGEFMTLRRLDTAFLKKQAEELSEKINASGETGDRSVQFRQWQSINGELIRRAKLENEQKMIEVLDETSASENPYSTFSLNISDASFQMAKAALEKGERPDPASIKPEQFYNAVEYGDPAPAAGEPVAATVEQSVHPVIPGRSLVRVAVRTGASGRSEAQPLRLTLLVDQSGSMVREDRRAAMEKALSQLSGLLTKDDVVNVIGFSRKARLLADGMKGDQSGKLGTLVNQTANEGGTNLEEAMKLGSELAARHQLAGAQNRIVLFTDGAANLGDADPARLADQVKTLRQKGISFDIAGIAADDLNDRLLSELARNGNGRYYVVGDGAKDDSFARQLAGAFRPAAENVKIQVIFNPRRVSRYKLVGFEKDRLKTEDFRNDAVDAAELAAEETGIAIYQVEEIPDGAGEIGELSVRFRDTASGDMVERSWTLPHASSATPFDRCTPSMQLAGLSLLAAEKLRGGPAADAIDFGQLSGTIGSVKQYYGSSSGVGDMLSLIDSIK
ncbi:MAG: DUF3520 domain-containing protein [Verrucomicrobiaceae bacterium]|nr:MAG: DUF3520 domain-containing protein [Verrucomicrobiaceae bacterium]